MSDFFTTPGEYMEKTATLGVGGKGLSLQFAKDLFSGLAKPKTIIPLALGGAALGTVGLLSAAGGEAPGKTLSYRVNKGLHGLLDRIQADEAAGGAFAKTLGSGMGESMVGLTRDIVSKGYETIKDQLMLSPTRHKIFDALKKEDMDIGNADNKTLMEAYHTMTNIAPILSTDKNAVKSVLRLAATSGGGLDFMTIKGIADAENSIRKVQGM